MWKKVKNQINKVPLLRSLRIRIFLLLVVMGMIPGFITRTALLQNYEERAVIKNEWGQKCAYFEKCDWADDYKLNK